MKLKVMTFNLRLATDTDGINNFFNRTDRVLETIDNELPDLIGFQEATDEMREFMRSAIGDTYVLLGCGRKANYRGEGVCIAYKRELFELVSLDTFWLSDTPRIAGSRYTSLDQSHCPRTAVVATLSPKDSEETFTFVNTHLDHKGAEARLAGMKQVMAEIQRIGGKFMLTGDMNASPTSEAILAATSFDGVTDCTANIETTFHNYGCRSKCKIDYIFTNGETLDAYAVADEPVNGVYISDHYPVCAIIEI